MSKGDKAIEALVGDENISQDDVDALKNRDLYNFVSGNKRVLHMLSKGTIDLSKKSLSYLERVEYDLNASDDEGLYDKDRIVYFIQSYLRSEAAEEVADPITRWLNKGDDSFCENPDFIREALGFFEAKFSQANSIKSQYSRHLLKETGNVKDALTKLDKEYPIEVADVRNIEIILGWLSNPNEDNNEHYDYGNDPDDPNGSGCSSEVTNSTNTNTTGVEDLGMTNSTTTYDHHDDHVDCTGVASPYDLTSNPV